MTTLLIQNIRSVGKPKLEEQKASLNLSIACAFVSVVVRNSIDLSGRDIMEQLSMIIDRH